MRTRDVADAAGGEACDVAEAAGGEACDVAEAAGGEACDVADAAGEACDVADVETRDETLRGTAAREMREAASAEAKDTSANAGIGAPRALAADDGFFFGLGAFETIAVEHGMPVFLDAHLARLKEALDFLGIERDEETLRTAVEGALANDERAAAENAATENARKEGERAAAANAAAENAPTDGAALSHVAPFGRRVLKLTVTAENMIVTMRDHS